MKNTLKKLLALTLVITTVLAISACGTKDAADGGDESAKPFVIAVPNDTTNEARALALLAAQGLITLPEGTDTTVTVRDIIDNPYNIEFKEVEAAQLPNVLKDVDFAVINSNYAIEAGITPFLTEGTDISYPNIIAVKEGNEATAKTKALIAAVNSQAVSDFLAETYKGAIVSDLTNPGTGYDDSVNYDELNGETVKVAASPTPHADILAVAAEVLAAKGITLEIQEFTDYVFPNNVVEDGTVDANYFQHVPYLEDFNKENGTHIVSVLEVHHEPMGIYSDRHADLSAIN